MYFEIISQLSIIFRADGNLFYSCISTFSGTQGTAVPSFQPRPYPAYGHSQHAFRPPAGLYNPNQRGQNGAAGYYGAPVMVSPGGYMRAGGSYPYGGGAGGSEAEYAHVHAHAQQFGQYAAGHRYPMYGTDMNNRSTYDPRKQSSGAQSGMDFSRTVSASFGENTSKSSNENKGRNEKESLDALHKFNAYYNRKAEDEESIGSKADSDRSWKLLNQVASIEEEKFRHEEAGRLGATSPIDEHLDSEKTNGSSRFTNMPTPSKLASLNSLSSVASAQEPLDTSNSKDELDLIQCASSGSLLFTTHDDTYAKRGREEREDRQDSVRGGEDELRRATSGSPPNVGNLSMKDEDYEDNGRPMKKSRSTNDDFYDNPPSYTFSLESAASFSKDQQFSTLPALPEKPRQSSYLGPLESKDKNDNGKDDLLLWEIKGQDSFPEGITPSFSFGKESSSGETENIGHADDMSKQDHNGRRSVQSHLSHDNNMKHEAETGNNVSKINDINKVNRTLSGTTKYPPRAASWVTGSSSFNRDPSHRMPTNLYAHNGTIPPPVRSYSGSVSMQSHHHRPGQMKQTGMLGNYSQDNSCGRSSPASSGVNSMASRYGPLHGPYGVPLPRHIAQSDAHLPPSFRPPVAALAGPVNIGRRAPPPAVYIMSSPPGGRPAGSHARHLSDSGDASKQQQQSGIYNWNKNDDSRLSEILKKFKNPKDWDSIAKEFGRGKT